tara:strand:- start:2605 stop:2760 length:156 start_codon:yes stop_codon:yes gene_type:complete
VYTRLEEADREKKAEAAKEAKAARSKEAEAKEDKEAKLIPVDAIRLNKIVK